MFPSVIHHWLSGWGPSSYSGEVYSDAPIGYWRLGVAGGVSALAEPSAFQTDAFQQASGATTMFDDSGYGRHGAFGLAPSIHRPDGDVAAGSWITAPLFSKINEATADDATTQILSESILINGATTTATVSLPTPTGFPAVRNGWRIAVRARQAGAAAALGTVTLALHQGATLIASVSRTLANTYGEHSLALTKAQADLVTDPTSLEIRMSGSRTGGGATDGFQVAVTQAYLEILPTGVVVGQPPLLSNTDDTATSFDGFANASVPVATWQQLTTQITLEAWIKPESKFSRGIIGRASSYRLHINDLGQLTASFSVGGVLTEIFAAASAIADNSVYHVAATYDGSVARLYINGAQVSSGALTGTLDPVPGVEIRLGASGSGSALTRFFLGIIDEAAIYKTALSAARILAHYNKGIQVAAAPVANLVSQTRTRISRVPGFDAADVVWTSDLPFTGYQFRVVATVSDPVTSGVQLEMNQSPPSGGAASTQYTSTLTDNEVEAVSPAEGAKIVKLFIQNATGWSS